MKRRTGAHKSSLNRLSNTERVYKRNDKGLKKRGFIFEERKTKFIRVSELEEKTRTKQSGNNPRLMTGKHNVTRVYGARILQCA